MSRSRTSFKLEKQFLAAYSEISLTLVRHLHSARKIPRLTVDICIFSTVLELALMLDLPEENINIWNVRNSVNSCSVHKNLLSLKYRQKWWTT